MNRQLINGDCLEELKKLDDNSVDLLCTDPPYVMDLWANIGIHLKKKILLNLNKLVG